MRVDLVLHGGVVVTGDPAAPRARAVAVRRRHRGGAGRGRARRCWAWRATAVDLEGGALLPSFGDGHVHPLWGGVELAGPPVREATSVAEVVEAVRRWAAAHPDVDWVQGGPYDPTLVARRPVRRGLAGRRRAGPAGGAPVDRPPLRLGEHRGAAPGRHRRRTPRTRRPARSRGGRTARPMGTLVEWTAMDLVLRHAPRATVVEQTDGLAAAGDLLAAAGDHLGAGGRALARRRRASTCAPRPPTGSPSARTSPCAPSPDRWPRPARRVRRGPARGRRVAGRRPGVGADREDVRRRGRRGGHGGDAVAVRRRASPHSCGLPVWSPDELAAAAVAFDADGFQLHIHAIGDAGVRAALDAVERVAAVNGPRDRRPVHRPHPGRRPGRPAAVRRARRGGEPRAAVGPARPAAGRAHRCRGSAPSAPRWQYPMASLLASGAVLSMGSDWPVSSYRPLEGLAVAVTRQTADGVPAGGWLPHQRLPVGSRAVGVHPGGRLPGVRGGPRGAR